MVNKILLVFIGFDLAFLLCAVLHLIVPLYTQNMIKNSNNVDNIANNLLLDHCPLTGKSGPLPIVRAGFQLKSNTASMVNSVIMFITTLLAVPAIFNKTNRSYLVAHCWGIVLSAALTFGIGVAIWFSTLETHKNLGPIFRAQSPEIQSMLQQRFQCCGYDNPAVFFEDPTCPNAATAALLGGCMTPFSRYANQFLDVVFTSFFGFVAVDMLTLLAAMCLITDRKEKERYRLIDEKRGYGSI